VYKLCPDGKKVTTHWKSLLAPFYQGLAASQVFYATVSFRERYWVSLQDAAVMSEGVDASMQQAVERVHEACGVSLACVPQHVLQGLKTSQEGVPAGRNLLRRKEVSPQSLSQLMKSCPQWQSCLNAEEKCQVLAYLCRHGDHSLLHDLELLPLADGTFCKFSDREVYVCRDLGDLHLLPGIKSQLCYVTEPAGLQDHLMNLIPGINSILIFFQSNQCTHLWCTF
jgi:hypothetical protein